MSVEAGCGPAARRRYGGFAALIATLTVLLSTVPYAYGYWLADADHVYVGLSPYRCDDANQYLYNLWRTSQGHWTFDEPYNVQPAVEGVFSAFFVAAGRLGRWCGFTPAETYRISRVLLAWVLLMSVYAVMCKRSDSRTACWAIALAGLSAGLGWLALLLGAPTGALDVPPVGPLVEAITFAAIVRSPLHLASMIIMLWYFHFLLLALERHDRSSLFGAALMAALLTNIHTYDYPTLALATLSIAGWLVRSRRMEPAAWRRLLIIGAATLLPLLHIVRLILSSPGFGAAVIQLGTVKPTELAITYGFLLVTAAYAVLRRHHLASPREQSWIGVLVIWALVGMAVVYLPVGWARKSMEGTHLPLCMLSAFAFAKIPVSTPRQRLARLAAFALLLPSNLFHLSSSVLFTRMSRHALTPEAPGAYLHRSEQRAFRWIDAHTPSDAVFTASFATANFLPAWAHRRVFAGHVSATVAVEHKIESVRRLYAGEFDEDGMRDLLHQNGITHLFWGPRERLWVPAATAEEGRNHSGLRRHRPLLERVYAREGVELFRVR